MTFENFPAPQQQMDEEKRIADQRIIFSQKPKALTLCRTDPQSFRKECAKKLRNVLQ